MNVPAGITSELAKQYGPFAFGIVSLLVIWFAIMQPELNRKQLDFEQHKQLIQQQHAENIQQAKTAETLRDVAQILDGVTTRIQAISNK